MPSKNTQINVYQIFVFTMLALINMQDGFDVLAISYAANAISNDWNISRSELGVVFSAGLFGMMIGAMLLSPIADKYGRKIIAIVGLFVSGCGMLIAMHSWSVIMLVIGRVLTGIGVGGVLVSLNTLTSEYASSKYRSVAVAIFQLGFPVGAFLSGFIVAWVLDISTWHYVFAFGAFTSFIFIPVVMILPESTVFLAKQNKPNALEKINRIRQRFGRPSLDKLPNDDVLESTGSIAKVSSLFSTKYRIRTMLIWMSFFTLLTVLYFMLTWIPKILVDVGFSEAQGNQGGRMINLMGMAGIILMGLLSFRFKPELITSFYMIGLFLILLLISTFITDFSVVIILISVAGMLLHGGMIGLYSTVPSLYAAHVRATGTGWAIGLSRFGAVLGPLLAGLMLDAEFTPQSLFQAFSVLAVLAAIFSALIYLEMRPKKLSN